MNQNYLTVSALTKYLKRKYDADPYLERVYLTGEISNFRLRPSHQYFSLKDDLAVISAVMFKGPFSKLNFQPEEGMKVLVIGRVTLYEARGYHQITIEHMEPDGVGALYQAYKQLEKKLRQEGLFDVQYKKQLVKYPKRIAVLTSPSGAVIRDILTTVERRYPIAQVVLFPTVVQGDQAASDLIKNLRRVRESGDFDTVILGRGGGSIEDLWPFNDEALAREIFSMEIPVISSVGHETDTTIADLVADVRAATPTAAAELATPVLTEEIMHIRQQQLRLENAFAHQLQLKQERFERVMKSYVFRQPDRLYEAKVIRLDQLQQQIFQKMKQQLSEKEKVARNWGHRLEQQQPLSRIQKNSQQVEFLTRQMIQFIERALEQKQQQFLQNIQALDLLSPLKIMSRGYSYTTKEDSVIQTVDQLEIGDLISLHFHDGQALVEVKSKEKEKNE